tara:strand:- start:128 stop:247 length:120 start_codon:yes stop_codon:yes gene_type:complete
VVAERALLDLVPLIPHIMEQLVLAVAVVVVLKDLISISD